jgi:hypothetical protein
MGAMDLRSSFQSTAQALKANCTSPLSRESLVHRFVDPTAVLKPFAGIEIRLYGRCASAGQAPVDWSIAKLTNTKEVGDNLPSVCSLLYNLNRYGAGNPPRVEHLYAPRPTTFNKEFGNGGKPRMISKRDRQRN